MIDLLISGGTVFDGSGAPPFQADVAVKNGLISDLGDLSSAEASKTIDAAGKYVCPGFIDAHSHSDTYVMLAPSAESKITQGITTEVVGNCGASAAPLLKHARLPSDWASMEYAHKWSTVADYRNILEKSAPAVNIVLLAGHNTLHGGVAGYQKVKVTRDHLKMMTKALEQALDEGASGMSSGLLYPPGLFAHENEVIELCKTVAAKDGIYTTHMRSETAKLIEALDETLGIAEKAGVRTQVSHLKAAGRENWHLLDKALAMIHDRQKAGLDIAADRYPYLAGCTDLDVVLPDWAQEGSREEIIERLNNPDSRKKIIRDLKASRPESDWGHVTIGSVTDPDIEHLKGTPLLEAADNLKLSPSEAVVHIVTKDKLRTSAFFAGMSEDNMIRVLSEKYVMLGTDASIRTTSGILSKDYPHPRAFGSFPRFLRMVIDRGFIDFAEAVKKITSLPAKQFSISRRGTIKKTYAADIVIIDDQQIRDTATYALPHGMSQGVDTVIVNGKVSLRQGCISEHGSGRFLAPREQ